MVNEPMQFRGIWIPLVTPFRQGRVDRTALARLVGHLAAQGVAGFVACGSTGEAAMLDPDEQDAVLATTLHAASGLPVLMGLAGTRPERVADRAQAAGRPACRGRLPAGGAGLREAVAGRHRRLLRAGGVGLAASPRGLRHPGTHRRAHRGADPAGAGGAPEHRGREGLQRRPRGGAGRAGRRPAGAAGGQRRRTVRPAGPGCGRRHHRIGPCGHGRFRGRAPPAGRATAAGRACAVAAPGTADPGLVRRAQPGTAEGRAGAARLAGDELRAPMQPATAATANAALALVSRR
jgi:hypothetical protein